MTYRLYKLMPDRLRTWVRVALGAVLRSDVAQEAIADRMRKPLIWGDPARIQSESPLYELAINVVSGTVTIEKDVMLSHHSMLLTGTHDYNQLGQARNSAIPKSGRDIYIEQGVMIGSGSIIQGPCRIGRHAVIFPGAVVTKDVEPFAKMAGIPAAKIGEVVARDA